MRITIDTVHDSKEEIKKMVDFLSTLISSETSATSLTTEQQDNVMAGFGNMFGESVPEEKPIEKIEEANPELARRIRKYDDDDEGTVVKFRDLITY